MIGAFDNRDSGESIQPQFVSDIGALETKWGKNEDDSRKLFVALWSLSETPIALRDRLTSLALNSTGFLLSYQLAHDGHSNVSWFEEFSDTASEQFDMFHAEIQHLPGNYYLFGTRRRTGPNS